MKRHINEMLHTTLANSGRAAGMGMCEDNYSEDSYGPSCHDRGPMRLPHDGVDPAELNGPVRVYRETRPINQAIKCVTQSREAWMLEHSEDWDADYFAGLYDNAIIALEKIKEMETTQNDKKDS